MSADFLDDGGVTGAEIRARDWTTTPLGEIESWPEALRVVLATMLASPQAMFLAWGPDLNVLFNDAYRPILGAKLSGAIGLPFDRLWSDVWPDVEPIVARALAGKGSTYTDMPLTMTRNGYAEETWWSFTYMPLRDATGAVGGMLCMTAETTSEVKAAAALRASERNLDALIRSSSEVRFRTSADWSSLHELVGGDFIPDTTSSNANWIERYIPAVDRAAFRAEIERATKSATTYTLEHRVNRVDGTTGWAFSRAVPVFDDAGNITEWYGAASDITARRRAETALHALNDTLEQAVEARTAEVARAWRLAQELLVIALPDGAIERVNPMWTRLLGWEEHELVGEKFVAFTHPEDLEATLVAFVGILERPLVVPHEYRFRHKDGSYRWFSWTGAFENGKVYAAGRHITTEREQAEALRQSQKMEAVGQLTGGLAHDFNNLLAGISGSLDMMGTRLSQGRIKDVDKYMVAAQGAAKRAAALTHRLLAFSRRQTLDPRPTDVNALVASMEDLVRRTVGPAVTIEVIGAAGAWPALVDPPQLENALLNLCINARDAMPDGGRLTIETANRWFDAISANRQELPPGQFLSLCVTDTGVGMPPEVIAKAFDPFFTTKPIGQGTGLGLSMIYGFAQQSGGQVRIYSEIGQGTTVCIYLPRHRGAVETAEAPAEPAAAPRATQGETVLVVDDEPTVRMLVTEVLEELGYAAIEAADSVAGLRVLQSDVRIDLLVTDVGLPGGMNGRQMADAGRAQRRGLKVLFITGYAENAAVGGGHLEPGMQVLTKPFAMETLSARIRELVHA